jgi:hypothetical protein
MSIWMAIKRVNRRYDEWSQRTVDRLITSVDHPDKPSAHKHISIRDLLAKGLGAEKRPP